MRVSLLCLGCRANQAENLRMESDLLARGHELVPLSSSPDVCIVNTCAVTGRAASESRQLVRRALKAASRVVATGCFAELHTTELPAPSQEFMVVHNKNKDHIIKLLDGNSSGHVPCMVKPSRQRAIVKVQDGCNNACAYCVVPLARGRSRSIEPQKVLEVISEYHRAGCNEVVLSGIHLGSYGADLPSSLTLPGLIREILLKTSLHRLRISSIEVTDINDELIELLTEQRVCSHLHVALQSGDEQVLRGMNRPYTAGFYRTVIQKVARRLPRLGLGTDIIAGFPGEGPKEYGNTVAMVKSLPFTYLHVFPFSPRPGTRAADLPGQVPESLKRQRVAQLREIADEKKEDYILSHSGARLEALIELPAMDGYACTTANYIKAVTMPAPGVRPGMLAVVEIRPAVHGLPRAYVVSS